ncbi:TonB-dependent siderophore receptor [Oscillatoriales cyanobacterium LEGE 11467]|uniref:TonB-dependent siderophore receptor n=1 Tax=Zarconia navalis LEGE 11467 TaxID=1828826 RepID=A0A928VYV1_9CYAN|nr:TonB-dependent siderophore receptor [Zarconia navalis]MBE9040678.1 TonB-dependent siderophore receptor [Zarconia navalis LEGE 11467]
MRELSLRGLRIAGLSLSSAIIVEPVLAQVTQIGQVRLETVEDRIEIILETTDDRQPEFLTSRSGTTSIIDAIDTQLAPGASFEQIAPAPGIESVTVQPQDGNVRITVVGSTTSPVVNIVERADGVIVLDVRVPALDIVVIGEQVDGSDYFVPEANAGTRTDTRLLDVPQSVQVIPQQLLEDQQATGLDEALRNTSGVVADTAEGSGFRFSIRGFERANILRDGFNLSASDSSLRGGLSVLAETANLERIEVLRGPASILYGDLNPGGVINLVTEKPVAEPFYETQFQVGSRGFISPQIDLSGPITSDERLLFRLNALYRSEDSFRDFDESFERFFVAPVIAWDIGDRTDVTVELEYLNDQRPYDTGTLAFGDGLVDIPRDRIANEPGDSREQDTLIAGYTFNHQFSERWQIRNAFRYGRQSAEGRVANPFAFDETTGILTRLDASVDNFRESVALQTNIVGDFDTGSISHELLFGADFSNNSTSRVTEGNFNAPLPINIFDPVYEAFPRDESQFVSVLDEFVRTNRLGIYLQDRVSFTDELTLLAGLRYDTVEQTLTTGDTFRGPIARIPGDRQSQDNDALTPRVGLVYQPIPELSFYTSYSRSFTPNTSTTEEGDFLEPEEGDGFEVGVKTELSDGRLFANLAYFNITRQNVAAPDPNATSVFNAFIGTGEQNSQGFEFDLGGELLPGWSLVASYSHIDAEVTEDTVIPIGNHLIGIPRNSASLWTKYTIPSGDLAGLGFGVGINYVGEREGDLNNSFQLDDYFLTNAAISYEREDWTFAVNFKNIFDVEYIQGSPINRLRNIEVGDPFTVLFSVSIEL